MKDFIQIFIALLFISPFSMAQEIRDHYAATSSYDLEVEDLRSDKESGKIYSSLESKARVYYNEEGDFVIIEQIEKNEDKPLEMSIIDFKNGTHILLKDKESKNAIIRSFSENKVPSYLKEEYQFELGEAMERDGISVTQASYTVSDRSKVDAKLEISEYIEAPNYLKWMPVIQHDLGSYFPMKIDYQREGKGGMLQKSSYNATNFQRKNPFDFATIELNLNDRARAKEDPSGKEVYGK